MVKRAMAIAGFFALAQAGSAAAQGSLRGTVTAAGTGSAISGAQVGLPDLGIGGFTGPGGAYEIAGIPEGIHEVVVTLIGYETERREVIVVDGQPTTLNVALTQTTLELGGLIAVGSRRARPRTVTESAVPVDVIAPREIVRQGDVDLVNVIRNVVPSFNVNIQPISDAATFVRPANLRGLAPDHTLVLVNGKRRHRAAVITWYGNGLADGSQGPDLALIPGLALEQAEVLRDGASAQYGSDAIAGVMNFVLRNDRSGGTIEFRSGGYLLGLTSEPFEEGKVPGDGEMYTLSGNVGLPLGETGFLNLTGEYGNTYPTDRSTQRLDAKALIDVGNTSVRAPAQVWGSPEVSNEVKLWANMGYVFGNTRFYSHGNFVSKQVEGGFYYRNPGTRSGVFGTRNADGERILLVGDMLDAADGVLDGSAGCPEVSVSDDGVVLDQTAFAHIMSDPNCFSFRKLFPGGFTPQFGSNVLDGSGVAGLKGTSGDLNWDASASWGKSNMNFYMYNTVNASLGPNQPCAKDNPDVSEDDISFVVPEQSCTPWFNPGIYDQQEMNFNVDLSYAYSDRINVAGGAEFRNERFEIVEGSEESWTEGPLATQGFTPGSNGFTGFGPLTDGEWNRSNFAGYVDVEFGDPDDAWLLDVAGRIERFSDFGMTANGKFAARVSVSEQLGLRASASTGFRAPTPGQQNAFNISTIYDPEIMDLTNNGTIPSTDPLAVEYNGKPLEPEKSLNLAVGAVYESGSFRFSTDFFMINASDRLTTSRNFELSPEDITRLVASGVIREGGVLKRFRFFINDFATRTTGIDLVGAYEITRASGSTTTLSSAWNWTRTTVTDFNPGTLTEHRIRILEEGLPDMRGILTGDHLFANGSRLLVRGSYWGGYFDGEQPYYDPDDPRYGPSDPEYDPNDPDKLKTIDYPARILLDVEASRTFAERWTLAIGAQNALNTYPEEYPGAAAGVGNRFGQFTPFGFNGGYYYTRVRYAW